MARCTICGTALNHYGRCYNCARKADAERQQAATASLHAKFAAEGYSEEDFPRLEAEERERQVREAREAVEKERKRVVREACEPFIEFLRKRSARNLPVYLYGSVYVPVDSVVDGKALNDAFSMDILKDLGLKGWEIVQVIPKTIGIALKNVGRDVVQKMFNEGDVSYGGGIGGNVAGVYVLVRKQLHPGWEDDEELNGEVRGFVETYLGYSAA